MKLLKVFAFAMVAIVGGAAVGSAVEVVDHTVHGTQLAPTVEILDFLSEQGFDVERLDSDAANDRMNDLTRDEEVYPDLKALVFGVLTAGAREGLGSVAMDGDGEDIDAAVYLEIAGFMWRLYPSEE